MKIALCGPEAAGKTTLATGLSERLGLPLIEDPRTRHLHGYATLYEAAKARPTWLELIADQVEREQATEMGVIDFCALDAWTLYMRWGWNHVAPYRVDLLEARCKAAALQVRHLIVMPEVQVAPFASQRFLNASHAKRMHQLVRLQALDWQLPSVIRLEAGDERRLLEQALQGLG